MLQLNSRPLLGRVNWLSLEGDISNVAIEMISCVGGGLDPSIWKSDHIGAFHLALSNKIILRRFNKGMYVDDILLMVILTKSLTWVSCDSVWAKLVLA